MTSIADRTSARTPAGQVVGRGREVELLEAALASGAHVVLEGPPGTGKSTLLRRVAADRESAFVLVEGNAELTPARLVGHFDPALVLERGYRPEVFVDGPLLEAMREGGLLYVEELNRVPEETLNVLLTVMSERELNVPRLGRVAADDGFRIVAAMNPYDTVGTARISGAVHDRTCRIVMGYQSAQDEHDITALSGVDVPAGHRASVVGLVRATRSHNDIRVGSSVRGAIDVVGIGAELARRRGVAPTDWQAGLDAALVALSGRIRLSEACTRTAEQVITDLWVEHFGARPTADDQEQEPDPGGGGGPGKPEPATGGPPRRPNPKAGAPDLRTTGRAQLSQHPAFAEVSPQVGVLDRDALDAAMAQDPDGTLALLADLTTATDESLRAAARRLAPLLVLDRVRSGRSTRSGTSRPREVPASRGGDLDIDRSMEAIAAARAERRPASLDDLVARDWGRPGLALVVLVDRSGSMSGARLATAAVTAAACALRARDEHAVIAFARDPTVLKRLDEPTSPATTVDRVLRLRGHGVTGLAGALAAAAAQLEASRAERKVVVLLSDCRATDEQDAVPVALRLPELLILSPADDSDEAAELARRTGARQAELASAGDAATILDRWLG